MRCPYQAPQRATRSSIRFPKTDLVAWDKRLWVHYRASGKQRIPVVLVEFADISFNEKSTIEGFNQQFKRTGLSSEQKFARKCNAIIFVDQSYGRFTPEFDVLGKVRLSRPRSFYGANIGNSKNRQYL